ncbi:hypothetical protein ADUPG1_012914, partial [Aduncisulcus paluster]
YERDADVDTIYGSVYYYFGEQVEVKCTAYASNIIAFYIYSPVPKRSVVSKSEVSERVRAAKASELKYSNIEGSKLIVPVRARK